MDHCDVCGDIGVADALLTCIQCKINTEHIYCMKIPLEKPIDDWRCVECQSSSKQKLVASCPDVSKINSLEVRKGCELRGESRKLPNESRVASGAWEKEVATGKTRYIPVKEALMLSTGERKPFAPPNCTSHSKPQRPNIGKEKSDRTPFRPRTVPINYLSQQDLASGPSRQRKPQNHGNMEFCERQLQNSNKVTEVLRSVSSPQPSQALKDKHMQTEQPIQWSRTKGRSLGKTRSISSLIASPITISGSNGRTTIDPMIDDAENVNNNILPGLENCSYAPALDALWKGSFSIHHRELNHQIQAHPPSRVRRKVYEFSKQMPKVLHFQLVPARKFWTNLFEECFPDERDIALYFLPRVKERLEDYIDLLESINVKGWALREQIDDVELLVFTSKLLPVNCQCWEGEYYLWGVFHRLKQDTPACWDKRVQESSVQPSTDASHAPNQVNDSKEDDMDIDMMGGINVGKMDIPVQREPLREKCTSLREESAAAAMALPRTGPQIPDVSRHTCDPGTTIPLLNLKTEPYDLVPPGFEEVYRLRMLGSPSSVANGGGRAGKEERTGR